MAFWLFHEYYNIRSKTIGYTYLV